VLHIETLKTVYFAYFHSLVKYSIIFGGYSVHIKKVFLLQEKDIEKNYGTKTDVPVENQTYQQYHVYMFSL
jgi:hypothetical protein